MSRKKVHRQKKIVLLEPKYSNPVLSKFIRILIWDGKLSIAEGIAYKAINLLEGKFKEPGIDIFIKALNTVKPLVKVKSRRIGGSTYQIPIEVPEAFGVILAMRWIVTIARKKKGSSMDQRLFHELAEAYEKRGEAFKKREETHKMAEANRAFAHYRA